MELREYVEQVLAPRLQGDGGWIEFASWDGNTLHVIFRGECAKCGILERCVDWCRFRIRADLSLDAQITYERRRPYFQDV